MSNTAGPRPGRSTATAPLAAWSVDEVAYPHSGPISEKLSFFLSYGIRDMNRPFIGLLACRLSSGLGRK